jgi:hypothetical protein
MVRALRGTEKTEESWPMASEPPDLLGTSGETAGPSGDIVTGGTTAYDTHAAASRALPDEGSTGGTYLARDLALSDGSGMNNPDALSATTVSASGRPDALIGGGGQDLFDAQAATDLVLDRADNEIVVAIRPKQP